MNVTRLPFTVPVLCIDDFLAGEEASAVLQECLDLKKVYMPATVFDGPNATKFDPEVRRNDVVYLDEVFRSAPERSDILTVLKRRIWADECRAIWHDGYTIFDVMNYATWHEAVISRYGKSGLYRRHQDTRYDRITYRLVTMVYYVNNSSGQFDGGSLTIWHESERVSLAPQHNRAVVFPSYAFHEVEELRSEPARWEDGRFSINYWMGFR